MPSVTLVEATSASERARAFDVRRRVFVGEQGIGESLEFDGFDAEASHLLALSDGEAVGTLRLRLIDGGGTAKIERVAVVADARGSRIGFRLVQAALDMARAAGAASALLHAQSGARGFYARLGFEAFGPEFVEDGIPHIAMHLSMRRGRMPPTGRDSRPWPGEPGDSR